MAVPAGITLANLSGEFIPVWIFYSSLPLTAARSAQLSSARVYQNIADADQDKALSDNADGFLTLQGVPWLLRKAIRLASPKLTITQSTNEKGVAVVDLSVVGIGGRVVTEQRVLDWEPVLSHNPLYGRTMTRSRLYSSMLERSPRHSDEDYAYLSARIAKDGSASCWAEGEGEDGLHLHCVISNEEGGWTIDQVWGFEEINGERYHTRRSVLIKGEAVERGRIVYRFVS
ncbi:hypothetical protein BJY04DRAFT_218622 [Aspergillus karnatakaensis]|uniref:uncharacterized protein n=1 Tax=Aspergillus karnatakaensis TaxID=1810916 RepID=UPI003CCE36A9